MLEDEFGGVLVGEAASREQVMGSLSEAPWDVIVLDLKLPGRVGLELLPDILVARPACPIVVMSSLPAHPYAQAVVDAGAACFLQKEHAPDELIPAIHSALTATPRCRGEPDEHRSVTPT